MQVEPYHTFDSGDEENYYEEYLKDLEAGYIKMYRNGYRCPRDPRNADSSYSSVLNHAECIANDKRKRPTIRAQHRAMATYMKNLPWMPYKEKNTEGQDEDVPFKKQKADQM